MGSLYKTHRLTKFIADAVHFDYNAGSAIVDLGSTRQLSSLKVFGKNSRISPEYLEIWLSVDGKNWLQDTTVSWQNDTEGLKATFTGDKEKSEPTARYVKLHSLWDERDQDYAPVDKSTFRGNLWNLFEISFIASGKENSYTYDARGNRLIENEKYGGNSNSTSTEYFYYANSDLIKKAGTWYFNYDKNGNLIAKGTSATEKTSVSDADIFAPWTFSETSGELWTYDYDLQNRMVKASYSDKGSANLKERSSYVYDYRGLLVKKTYRDYVPSNYVQVEGNQASKSVTEFYEYTPDGRIIYNECVEENTTNKTTYIWANQTLWCEINEGVVYYHHTDHLGTTEVITDCNGTVVWEAGYEAFGSVLSERGDSSFTPSYTGKFFDKASGLYYFNARWYDSELGRFTTQDPIRDGMNWYAYCNNSSLIFTDPLGLYPYNNLNEAMEDYYTNYATEADRKQLQFFGLINQASMGNKLAQNTLHYAFYEASKEMLQEFGDASGNASLVFLAIGLPEVSTVLGGIDTVSDAVLSIDKINNGNKNNDLNTKIEGYIELGSSIGGIVASEIGVKAITNKVSSSVKVTIGKNGRYYELGRRGALKSKKAIQKLVKKHIAEGYFGQNIAPELAAQIVDKVGEATLVVSGVKEKKEKLSIGEKIFPQLRNGGKDEKKN